MTGTQVFDKRAQLAQEFSLRCHHLLVQICTVCPAILQAGWPAKRTNLHESAGSVARGRPGPSAPKERAQTAHVQPQDRPRRIPKGSRPKAQGCATALPWGSGLQHNINPEGVVSQSLAIGGREFVERTAGSIGHRYRFPYGDAETSSPGATCVYEAGACYGSN